MTKTLLLKDKSSKAAINRTNHAYQASGIEHRESSIEQFFFKKV
jgi:hypothetical protein